MTTRTDAKDFLDHVLKEIDAPRLRLKAYNRLLDRVTDTLSDGGLAARDFIVSWCDNLR